MRAAIYARYSSESQSDKSIDDQVRVCKRYIKDNDMTVQDQHIFFDEAMSGSLAKRPGLDALEQAMQNREFDAVVVDDLSRLSRSNHQMLTLVLKFDYHSVQLISVSDGIITGQDNAKLGIHIRGFINELYLDDLKKKTLRGLEGQKLRGFSVGEKVFGYRSKPYGEMKLDRKGQPHYEGKVHFILETEAHVVKRIFKLFTDGASLNEIARTLNAEEVPTKKGLNGGWNRSTLSYLLKNEKYIGIWAWRKSRRVRDPLTGKAKSVPCPKDKQVKTIRDDLIIIDKDMWSKAQARWDTLQDAFPLRKSKRGEKKQKSCEQAHPTYLLSGMLTCNECSGAIVLVSGKGGGYYGCYNARRNSCTNRLIVSRKRIETAVIGALKEQLMKTENLSYIYDTIEKMIKKGLNEVPEIVKQKKTEYDKMSREMQNYLNYIKAGNFSNAVSEALADAEKRSGILKEELELLDIQRHKEFEAPPPEWIEHRVEKLNETLNKNTRSSALALKELLGTIKLEPISDIKSDYYELEKDGTKQFKPFYVAHTKIQTLALLDESCKGSNCALPETQVTHYTEDIGYTSI